MNKVKYPSINFTPELWKEISSTAKAWGCRIDDSNLDGALRIVSNFGQATTQELCIGLSINTMTSEYRYVVKTKEEFLEALSKIVGKSYNPDSYIKINKLKRLKLNFKL